MPDVTVLQRGDIVPHFEAQTVTGAVFNYSAIWQRKNLVLVSISPTDPATSYVHSLRDRDVEFNDRESVCVITHDRVAGLPSPGALIADRWGEIIHLVAPIDIAGLPAAQELLDWVEYVENRCPECEGEAK